MIQFKGDSVLTFPAPLMTDTVIIELSLRTRQVSIETVCSFSGLHVFRTSTGSETASCQVFISCSIAISVVGPTALTTEYCIGSNFERYFIASFRINISATD